MIDKSNKKHVTFNAPTVKRAIRLAQEMGLTVSGFDILADGGVRIVTNVSEQSEADAALDRWVRLQQHAD